MHRRSLVVVVLIISVAAGGCNGSAPGDSTAVAEDAWWIFERDGFEIAAVAISAEDRGGHRWTLEYTSGQKSLQIVAWSRSSAIVRQLIEANEKVGTAMVEGFGLTLRRFDGIEEDRIPPSVGADWLDGGLLLGFGGAGLDEAELRSHLEYLRRVDQTRWENEVTKANERNAPFKPPVTTRL